MSKVKEFYHKQLEDDREFELGYLDYLYQISQNSMAVESDNVKLQRLAKMHSFHTSESISTSSLNNCNYDPDKRA